MAPPPRLRILSGSYSLSYGLNPSNSCIIFDYEFLSQFLSEINLSGIFEAISATSAAVHNEQKANSSLFSRQQCYLGVPFVAAPGNDFLRCNIGLEIWL